MSTNKYPPSRTRGLKPCVKGEIRNPEGARAHDPVRKELKKAFSGQYMNEIIKIAVMGKKSELDAIAQDPEEPAIRRTLAKALSDAVTHGSWGQIENIVTRIIGKIPDKVAFTDSDGNDREEIKFTFHKAKNDN